MYRQRETGDVYVTYTFLSTWLRSARDPCRPGGRRLDTAATPAGLPRPSRARRRPGRPGPAGGRIRGRQLRGTYLWLTAHYRHT